MRIGADGGDKFQKEGRLPNLFITSRLAVAELDLVFGN